MIICKGVCVYYTGSANLKFMTGQTVALKWRKKSIRNCVLHKPCA